MPELFDKEPERKAVSAQLPESINRDIEAYIEARLKRFAYEYELARRKHIGGTTEP